MAAPKYRVVGRLKIPANSKMWVRYIKNGDPPSAWEEIDLSASAAGLSKIGFYINGAGDADDMLPWLSGLISAALEAGGASSETLELALSPTVGIVTATFAEGAGDLAELAFSDPTGGGDEATSFWVRDWLRLDETLSEDPLSIESEVPVVGYRFAAFSLYPSKVALKDNDVFIKRMSQAVSDSGRTFTLKLAERKQHKLGVWLFDSLPRASAWNDYHMMDDFLSFASNGWPVRYYADRTVTTPWEPVSNPFGYETWVVARESLQWEVTPKYGNYLKQQQHELMLIGV